MVLISELIVKMRIDGLDYRPLSLLMRGLAMLAPDAVEVLGHPATGLDLLGHRILAAMWGSSVDGSKLAIKKRTPP